MRFLSSLFLGVACTCLQSCGEGGPQIASAPVGVEDQRGALVFSVLDKNLGDVYQDTVYKNIEFPENEVSVFLSTM